MMAPTIVRTGLVITILEDKADVEPHGVAAAMSTKPWEDPALFQWFLQQSRELPVPSSFRRSLLTITTHRLRLRTDHLDVFACDQLDLFWDWVVLGLRGPDRR